MTEFELELRKGDLIVRIRGVSKEDILKKIGEAVSLIEDVTKELKEKKVKLAPVPIVSAEIPSIAPPTSCRDAILKLLSTDWGKIPRTLGEIIEAMKINGIYYPKSTFAAELLGMTRAGITRRIKTETGFAYILAKPA